MLKSNINVPFQKEEVSAELLTFHEVVNHMQEDEEEVINDHSVMVEVSMIMKAFAFLDDQKIKQTEACVIIYSISGLDDSYNEMDITAHSNM